MRTSEPAGGPAARDAGDDRPPRAPRGPSSTTPGRAGVSSRASAVATASAVEPRVRRREATRDLVLARARRRRSRRRRWPLVCGARPSDTSTPSRTSSRSASSPRSSRRPRRPGPRGAPARAAATAWLRALAAAVAGEACRRSRSRRARGRRATRDDEVGVDRADDDHLRAHHGHEQRGRDSGGHRAPPANASGDRALSPPAATSSAAETPSHCVAVRQHHAAISSDRPGSSAGGQAGALGATRVSAPMAHRSPRGRRCTQREQLVARRREALLSPITGNLLCDTPHRALVRLLPRSIARDRRSRAPSAIGSSAHQQRIAGRVELERPAARPALAADQRQGRCRFHARNVRSFAAREPTDRRSSPTCAATPAGPALSSRGPRRARPRAPPLQPRSTTCRRPPGTSARCRRRASADRDRPTSARSGCRPCRARRPRSCRTRTGRRARAPRPFTVACASCWGTVQYSPRALVRETTRAVRARPRARCRAPSRPRSAGTRAAPGPARARRRGTARAPPAARPRARSRSRTTCRGTGRAAEYSQRWMSRALQSLTSTKPNTWSAAAAVGDPRAGFRRRSRSRARARCPAAAVARTRGARSRGSWPRGRRTGVPDDHDRARAPVVADRQLAPVRQQRVGCPGGTCARGWWRARARSRSRRSRRPRTAAALSSPGQRHRAPAAGQPLLDDGAQGRPRVAAEREQRVQHRPVQRAGRQAGLAPPAVPAAARRRRTAPPARAARRSARPRRTAGCRGRSRSPGGSYERAPGMRTPWKRSRPGLLHWTAFRDTIGQDVHSYFHVPSGTLLDPMEPRGGLEAVAAERRPQRIVLTNRHHYRHSDRFREAFGCPVLCHEAGLHEFEAGEVEGFAFGDELAPGVTAREVGVLAPEETAVHLATGGGGALAFADAADPRPARRAGLRPRLAARRRSGRRQARAARALPRARGRADVRRAAARARRSDPQRRPLGAAHVRRRADRGRAARLIGGVDSGAPGERVAMCGSYSLIASTASCGWRRRRPPEVSASPFDGTTRRRSRHAAGAAAARRA